MARLTVLAEQISEVSGMTNYRYDEHGALVEETDARGVTTRRTLDALDRVRFVDSEDDQLDTAYTYDDPLTAFSQGRLTAIDRASRTVRYEYDRFGRLATDGELRYAWDPNSNRRQIVYPGDVTASSTFDFADRPTELVLGEPGESPKTIATGAEYLASGPLTALILGNGVNETRGYDQRYFPASIHASGSGGDLLDWTYTTDAVGNILAIADGGPGADRSFGHLDYQYFLTQGDGPWGNLAWSYDKIGNRLSETRDGETSVYGYYANLAGGRNPKLNTITPQAPAPTTYFYFDAAGDQTHESTGEEKLRFDYDADRRLAKIFRDAAGELSATTEIRYDGRGFLERSSRKVPAISERPVVETFAAYASEGVLMHRFTNSQVGIPTEREADTIGEDAYILYFGSRPVAILEVTTTTPFDGPTTTAKRILYLTTDHLGTPTVASDGSGAKLWGDGFEPFGADYSGASEAGVMLRLPGQWNDQTWEGTGLAQNVYRWLSPQTGRYSTVDPKYLKSEPFAYLYAMNRPALITDPLGLDNVGCTLPPNIKGLVETSCGLECCAQHDQCYDDWNCTSDSWYDPTDGCGFMKCMGCNDEIMTCLHRCVLLFRGDNPDKPNFYCPAKHDFIEIPSPEFPDINAAEMACEYDHSKDLGCSDCPPEPPLRQPREWWKYPRN